MNFDAEISAGQLKAGLDLTSRRNVRMPDGVREQFGEHDQGRVLNRCQAPGCERLTQLDTGQADAPRIAGPSAHRLRAVQRILSLLHASEDERLNARSIPSDGGTHDG